MAIHRFEDAMVHGGQVVLQGIPLPEGSHVQVVVTEITAKNGRGIDEVRRLLRGAVERFDDPFEPVISPDAWEMLK